MDGPEAEILALKALGWAAAQEGALQRFVAATGIEFEDLRLSAGNSEFLAAFVDCILSDDALTKSFCTHESIEARQLQRARYLLPGGRTE